MRLLGWGKATLLLACLVGCGSGIETQRVCVEGEAEVCSCTNGSVGSRECSDQREYGPCICGDETDADTDADGRSGDLSQDAPDLVTDSGDTLDAPIEDSDASEAVLDSEDTVEVPELIEVLAGLQVDEGRSVAITPDEVWVDAPGVDNEAIVFTLLVLPERGELWLADGEGSTLLDDQAGSNEFTLADIAGEQVSYQHDGSTPTEDSFAFSVTDGVRTSDPLTLDIDITPTNDAPTIGAIGGATIEEDPAVSVERTLRLDDEETPSELSVSWTSSNTTLLPQSALTVDANILSISPQPDEHGSATIRVTVTDPGDASAATDFTVTVEPVNDAPVNHVPAAQTVAETGSLVFGQAGGNALAVDDVDILTGDIAVTVHVGSGTLQLASTDSLDVEGDGTSSVSATGPLAAANAALDGLTYTAGIGAGDVTLTLSCSDRGHTGAGGAGGDEDTVIITVTDINLPPVNQVPETVSGGEHDQITFGGGVLVVSDPDAEAEDILEVTLAADSGWVAISSGVDVGYSEPEPGTVKFTGTLAQLNGALGVVTYDTLLEDTGTDTLTMTTNDKGNRGGPEETDVDTVTIQISGVNDPPVVDTEVSSPPVSEDGTLVFSSSLGRAITVDDVDAGDHPLTMTVEVARGQFNLARLDEVAVVGGAQGGPVIEVQGTVAQLNSVLDGLTYIPVGDVGGSVNLTVLVDDEGHSGTGGSRARGVAIQIEVQDVNDAPELHMPAAQEVGEDSTLFFTAEAGNLIQVSDIDAGNGTMELYLTSEHPFSLGGAEDLEYLVGDGSEDTEIRVRGSQYALNQTLTGMTFEPNSDFAGDTDLTVSILDLGATGGEGLSDDGVVAIHVIAVNDQPVITGPSTDLTVAEDSPAVLEGAFAVTVDDVDGGDGAWTLQLEADAGGIYLGDAIDIEIESGAEGTSQITLDGSLEGLNDALDGLRVEPPDDYVGGAFLTLTVYDNGQTGEGDPEQEDSAVSMVWTAQNDAPAIRLPDAQTVANDEVLAFSQETDDHIVIVDVDAGSNVIEVSLDVAHGTVDLDDFSVFTVTDGADGSNHVIFEGSLAAVNAALYGLTYTPDVGYVGPDELIVWVDDRGHSGAGGPETRSVRISITVTGDSCPPANVLAQTRAVTLVEPCHEMSPAFDGGCANATEANTGGASTWQRTNEPVEIPLANGIVNHDVLGYWPLDWDGSQDAPDRSPYDNPGGGALTTASVGAFGGENGGFAFDGQNSKVWVLGTYEGVGVHGFGLTVAAWFKATDIHGAVPGWIVNKEDVAHTSYGLYVQDGLVFGVVNSSEVSGELPSVGEWHHLAVTYDGSRMMGYLNGVLFDNQPLIEDIIGVDPADLVMGFRNVGEGEGYFDGAVDDVVILNRAMSASELAAYVASGAPYGSSLVPGAQADFDDVRVTQGAGVGTTVLHEVVGARPQSDSDLSGVLAYWPLAGSAEDLGPDGYHGVTQGTTSGVSRFGQPDEGVVFDGVDDTVSTGFPLVAGIDDSFTIEAWVRLEVGASGTIAGFWTDVKGALRLDVEGGDTPVVEFRLTNDEAEESVLRHETDAADGQWHHLAFVRDAQRHNLYLFVDGLPAAGPVAFTGNLDGTLEPLTIGYWNRDGFGSYFDGQIAEVIVHDDVLSDDAIYNRANPRIPTLRLLASTDVDSNGSGQYDYDTYSLYWGNSETADLPPIVPDPDGGEPCLGLLSPCNGYAGWWRFEGAAWPTVVDASTNRNHGTAQNGAEIVSGGLQPLVEFVSNNRYIEVPWNESLELSLFSLEGVARRYDTGSAQTLLMRGSGGTPDVRNYWLAFEPTGVGSSAFDVLPGGALGVASDAGVYGFEQWQQVGSTYDGSQLSLVADFSVVAGGPAADPPADDVSMLPLLIGVGRYDTGGFQDYLSGKVAHIRVSNRALSTDEMLHYPLSSWSLGAVEAAPDTCVLDPD